MTGTADEQALMRRLGWRLMPVLVLMFLVAFIDRQNIGFAKLQMVSDLHISEAAFAIRRHRCSSSAMWFSKFRVRWRCSATVRDAGSAC